MLQESFLDARRQFAKYAANPEASVYFWLRNIVSHRLGKLHRFHLDTQMRDAKREMSLDANVPGASSVYLATLLAASTTSVDQRLVLAEAQAKLQHELDAMEFQDREIIALRAFRRTLHGGNGQNPEPHTFRRSEAIHSSAAPPQGCDR